MPPGINLVNIHKYILSEMYHSGIQCIPSRLFNLDKNYFTSGWNKIATATTNGLFQAFILVSGRLPLEESNTAIYTEPGITINTFALRKNLIQIDFFAMFGCQRRVPNKAHTYVSVASSSKKGKDTFKHHTSL